jgi:UDP-glucose 4-epimerase
VLDDLSKGHRRSVADGAVLVVGSVGDRTLVSRIPIVLAAARGELEAVTIFGDDYPTADGTCIRDYIHVSDLARAHVLALRAGAENAIYNLGTGTGYSVREVIDAAEAVTGRHVPVRVAHRRSGDPAVLVASSDHIRAELGWEPRKQDLRVIVGDAWHWSERRRSDRN